MPTEEKNIKKHKKWHQKWWGILFLFIVAVLFFYFGVFVYQLVYLVEAQNKIFYQNFDLSQPSGANDSFRNLIEVTTDPYWGPKDAKVVIVEFVDFQCPYCKEAYPVLKKIKQNYQNSVKFIFRDFPNIAGHPDALNAALAGRCAEEQNKFWQMHDLMFGNQSDLSADNLNLMAQSAGLDLTMFNQCFASQKYLSKIQSDLQDGIKFGLNGTPTFFINGNMVAGVIPYDSLKLAIDNLLFSNANAQENYNINSNSQPVQKCAICGK